MTDTVTDRDVYVTRSFDAPRALLWKFWTEPDRLAEWFGPDTVTTPRESVSITPEVGGEWNLIMRDSATGAEYPMNTRFVEVREPEYLEMVIDAATSDIAGEIETLRLRVTFHDHGEKTRVTLHQGPFTDEQKQATSTGWEQSFVKLDAIFAGGVA
jgi:uncharacterized protein YndB with AHSA1/START domain